jgi:uncharacterized membrane protein YdbT with pleckstrin-like domain
VRRSFCLSQIIFFAGTICPCIIFKQFSLRLDSDSLQLSSAANDCCCHVAESTKSVPLEKITDVELQESCLHTCFGLKSINVQTAGSSAPGPHHHHHVTQSSHSINAIGPAPLCTWA